MARVAPRRNGANSLDPNDQVEFPSKVLWT